MDTRQNMNRTAPREQAAKEQNLRLMLIYLFEWLLGGMLGFLIGAVIYYAQDTPRILTTLAAIGTAVIVTIAAHAIIVRYTSRPY